MTAVAARRGTVTRLSCVLKMGLVLGLPLAGPAAHVLVYLLLAVWAWTGPRRAIEALTLSWLVSFLNPGIYELSAAGGLLRWVVLASAAAGVGLAVAIRGRRVPRTLLWFVGFATVVGLMAAGLSYAPAVSLLKLISFFLAVGTILVGFHTSEVGSEYWRRWFLTLFGSVVLAGLPLVVRDVGFFRNQRGFQGVLSHPQSYGIFIGAMLPWVLFLKLEGRRGRWLWALIAIASVSLVLTRARTGMLAALGGTGSVALWSLWRRADTRGAAWRRAVRLSPLAALVLVAIFVQRDRIRTAVLELALKGQMEQDLNGAFSASRGALVARSWGNFLARPVTGIGFGLASEPTAMKVQRVGGLPIGASVEKGFAPTAALEELGLVGFTLLLVFLVSWMAPMMRRGVPTAPLALALGALLVNVGESVLFAGGGMGLLIWLLLGAARVTAQEAR